MYSHMRSQSMPTMPARFGGQPQQNTQAAGAGAGAAAVSGPASAAAPPAGYATAAPAPTYYSAPPTPSPIVYVDPQQAAYFQHAAAAAGGYPLAGADWSSQQQLFQQAAVQQQQQQQQMIAAGAAVVPTYDWSALYAAAYPPKESDAAGSSDQQAAQAQAQAQAQQAYSDYYNYLNQEAFKAMSMPPQSQPSQPGSVLQTPPPPFALDFSQPGAIELYNQQMQQAYAAQTQAAPVTGFTTSGAVGAFYPAVYSPEYLQQMAVMSSPTMAAAVPAAAAATFPASAPTTPLMGPMPAISLPAVAWVPAATSPSRAHGPKGFGSTGHGAEPGPRERREQREAGSVDKDPLTYRTEVCRTHLTTGHCDYGTSCQFAHGVMELRSREFDSKYKTELCKNYYLFGSQSCFFASRCKFIHDEYRLRASEFEFWLVSPSENLVRVEIVDPRNYQRLEQLTTLVNNPPKPPVSPLKPTERTLFHQQLEEEKARADTLIAATAEQITAFPAAAATETEIPVPPDDTAPVAEPSADRPKDERDDQDLASRLSSVHVSDEPEPGSRPGHNPFSPTRIAGNNRAHASPVSHVSPVSLLLNHSPSLSPVACPRSPVARVRQEEMLQPSTVPPLVAASVAPTLHSPQRSPSHHSLVEHRRARLMELARPLDSAFGHKEEEKQQQGPAEQIQHEQIEGDAGAQQSAVQDSSRMPLLDLAAAAPPAQAAPTHPPEDKLAETAVSSAPPTAPPSSSARVPSSLSVGTTSAFERESAQDVRVRTESGGVPLVYPRVQQRRRGGGGGGWGRDQPHPFGFNHPPAHAGAMPLSMTAAAPAAPHPSSLYLGAVLDPSTGAMHQATLSFPIMSNAPISFQQAQQQQYRMQNRRGGGGGGGGGRAQIHQQQRMQYGGGAQMQPMNYNSDVRALTGIVPIEQIPSPVQRVSHPAPGESSGRLVSRSLSSPSSAAAQFASSPSLGASSTSPNQNSPKPLWLEQQSRAMHLPVFDEQQQQAQAPQAEGEVLAPQQDDAAQTKSSHEVGGEQRGQHAGGFRD